MQEIVECKVVCKPHSYSCEVVTWGAIVQQRSSSTSMHIYMKNFLFAVWCRFFCSLQYSTNSTHECIHALLEFRNAIAALLRCCIRRECMSARSTYCLNYLQLKFFSPALFCYFFLNFNFPYNVKQEAEAVQLHQVLV